MKSLVEEASSVVKAIEKAWNRAGNPETFSIKVFETPETNFFGFTKKSAKVGIFFSEEQAAPQTTKRQSTQTTREPQQKRAHGQHAHTSTPAGSPKPQQKEYQNRRPRNDRFEKKDIVNTNDHKKTDVQESYQAKDQGASERPAAHTRDRRDNLKDNPRHNKRPQRRPFDKNNQTERRSYDNKHESQNQSQDVYREPVEARDAVSAPVTQQPISNIPQKKILKVSGRRYTAPKTSDGQDDQN